MAAGIHSCEKLECHFGFGVDLLAWSFRRGPFGVEVSVWIFRRRAFGTKVSAESIWQCQANISRHPQRCINMSKYTHTCLGARTQCACRKVYTHDVICMTLYNHLAGLHDIITYSEKLTCSLRSLYKQYVCRHYRAVAIRQHQHVRYLRFTRQEYSD